MLDFITIGSATRDVFVSSPALRTDGETLSLPLGAKVEIREMRQETGGGATNAAVTFSRLGYRTSSVFCVGRDPDGRDVLEALAAEGVGTDLSQTHPDDQTAYSVILLTDGGERTVLAYRGAAERLDAEAVPWDRIASRWLYVTSLAGRIDLMERILAHAAAIGAKVAWNPGSRELRHGIDALRTLIERTDVMNLNLEEANQLFGETGLSAPAALDRLRGLPRTAAVITDGIRGAYASDGKDSWHALALDAPRVNVTGAGDAFGSGLTAGLDRSGLLAYGMAVGIWNATGVVQITGAKKGLLDSFPDNERIAQVKVNRI